MAETCSIFLTGLFIFSCWQLHAELNRLNLVLVPQSDHKLYNYIWIDMTTATGYHHEFQPSEEFHRCAQWIFSLYTIFENTDMLQIIVSENIPWNYFLLNYTNYDGYINSGWQLIAIFIFFLIAVLFLDYWQLHEEKSNLASDISDRSKILNYMNSKWWHIYILNFKHQKNLMDFGIVFNFLSIAAKNANIVIRSATETGLTLNARKCDIVATNFDIIDNIDTPTRTSDV